MKITDDIARNRITGSSTPTLSPERRRVCLKLLAGIGIVGLLATGYWALSKSGTLEILLDGLALRERIIDLGVLGSLAVIGSMAIAIVINSIPSAPIALMASAANE